MEIQVVKRWAPPLQRRRTPRVGASARLTRSHRFGRPAGAVPAACPAGGTRQAQSTGGGHHSQREHCSPGQARATPPMHEHTRSAATGAPTQTSRTLTKMVTRLAWMDHSWLSSNRPTRCASAASCSAVTPCGHAGGPAGGCGGARQAGQARGEPPPPPSLQVAPAGPSWNAALSPHLHAPPKVWLRVAQQLASEAPEGCTRDEAPRRALASLVEPDFPARRRAAGRR